MSQDDEAISFRPGMEAYSRGDYEAAQAGFDPAIEWSVHASVAPDATTYHGHDGVKRFWETWAEAISDMELEIEESGCVGQNRVLAITRGTRNRSGQRRARRIRAFRTDRRLPGEPRRKSPAVRQRRPSPRSRRGAGVWPARLSSAAPIGPPRRERAREVPLARNGRPGRLPVCARAVAVIETPAGRAGII
jgi:ketosteroid isomerase-like protein